MFLPQTESLFFGGKDVIIFKISDVAVGNLRLLRSMVVKPLTKATPPGTSGS